MPQEAKYAHKHSWLGAAVMTQMSTIPLVDLHAAHAEVADEIAAGFGRVLSNSAFIKGAEVAAFEREFASFCATAHCVGVANGTDAIELALRATGLPVGAEVVLPANTFVATAEAVVRAGGRPVFADVDPDYLLLDPLCVSKAINPQTAAIIPVHLYGQLAPLEALTEVAEPRGVVLIEDAAQAHGATQAGRAAGAVSAAAATSFYPGKNLGAYGDAGAVLTNSGDIARRARLLGDHGCERKYEHSELGFNSRMDALQAVVLLAKLSRLAKWNELRRQAAARYTELLSDIDGITLPRIAPGNVHVWHLYVIQVPRRNQVIKVLNDHGIQAAIHYPVPVHLQPAFRAYGYGPGAFPVAEAAAERILSLPLYPHITANQQLSIAKTLRLALDIS
jgi:dTDP-4-amino-4,6-dideoxygalactose transaminase